MNGENLEQATIQRLWDAVQAKTGATATQKARVFDFIELLQYGQDPDKPQPNMGVSPYDLAFTPGITKVFSERALSGILAHELAHVALGHVKGGHSKQQEQDADDWAVAHGYGAAQIEAFQTMSQFHNGSRSADKIHKPMNQRVTQIKRTLKQQTADQQLTLNLEGRKAA